MENALKDCLWKNFGAATDMLADTISICPDELWNRDKRFFYMTFHTVIFLDYYLTAPVRAFRPALPYTVAAPDNLPVEAIDDVLPDRIYTKEDFFTALSAIREKCRQVILGASEEQLTARWISDEEAGMHDLCPSLVVRYNLLEILFYNLRHVQHHVAQLNLMLRQNAGVAVEWVSHAD